jgi:hypothetical protein
LEGFFWECKSLECGQFEIGSELETIEANEFRGSGLNSIALPKSVKVIGNYAFFSWESLTAVTFQEGSALQMIGNDAFRNSGWNRIMILASVQMIGDRAF